MHKVVSFFAAALVTAVLVSSCQNKTAVQLRGEIEGASSQTTVILKRLDFNEETLIDTLQMKDNGAFVYEFEPFGNQPEYYYCYANDVRVADLILQQGDNVSFKTTLTGTPLTIEGSEESVLLQQANGMFTAATRKFDSLYVLYEQATSEDVQQQLNLDLGRTFIKYKQDAIKFMFGHPYSFVNTTMAFQTFKGSLFVFSDSKDGPLLRRVYDSLSVAYPTSAYVEAVSDRAVAMERALQMENALQNVAVTDFPDVCAPDNKAQTVCLSSLKGNTIVLAFWHTQNVDMRLENQELLSCYEKYASKGLAVYQVALDTDKAVWAAAVREQQLPWISVCDGLGVYSPAVATYGITEVPTFFVIDKVGNLLSKGHTVAEVEKTLTTLF